MEVKVLGMHGGEANGLRSSAYLVNGRVLLDAGGGASCLTDEEALGLEACLLTHAHLDHTYALPMLLDRRIGHPTLSAFSIGPVVQALSAHMFNGALWPDMTKRPTPDAPLLRLIEVQPRTPLRVGGLLATAIEVAHSVPGVAWLLEEEGGARVLFSGDTGPTREAWDQAAKTGIAGAFIEVSYPNRMAAQAARTGHLTPSDLASVLRLLPPSAQVKVIHLKPDLEREIEQDLAPLAARVEVARPLAVYRF